MQDDKKNMGKNWIKSNFQEIPGNSRPGFDAVKFPGIPEREFPVALLDTRFLRLDTATFKTRYSILEL